MRIDRFKKRSLRQDPVCIELLEARQLLSGTADGDYSGVTDVTLNGQHLPTGTTVNVVPDGKGGKKLDIKTPIPMTVVEEDIEDVESEFHPSALHVTGNAAFGAITPAASHTFLVGTLPQTTGGGVVQIEDNHLMTIDGTFAPGKLLNPLQYSFSGTKVSSAAVPQQAEAVSVVKPLTTKKKKNPLLGIYKGTITDTQHGLSYGVGVTEYRNKKGNFAITATIAVPGFGKVIIASVNHPHSSGSFDLALGPQVQNGILSGHITHTGKLVFTVRTIGLSVTTGTLKRLA